MILRLAALLILWAGGAAAADCSSVSHLGTPFTICEADPAKDDIRLFLADDAGLAYGSFEAVERAVGPLAFAMNGGMYHPDRSPVGHYVEDGREVMRVIPGAGPGNFGMLPNGVFCVGDGTARVWETTAFLEAAPDCRFATQSGPMLLMDGRLHPRFVEGSRSRLIRNGVGTSADGGRVVFAISDAAVNFHDFATLFRDTLDLPDALYLDGRVSRLHAPALGRSDAGFAMGPILGVVR